MLFLMQKRKVGGGAPPELQLPRRFWHLLLDKEVRKRGKREGTNIGWGLEKRES